MKISVAVMPKSVAVMELAQRDGQWVSAGSMFEVHEGYRLNRVPYDRLRAMGDGGHAMAENERLQVYKEVNSDGPIPWYATLFFALFFLGLAFAGYEMFDNWETEGGRIRVHWFVGLVYGLGGKSGVAAAMAAVAVILSAVGVRTKVTGTAATNRKREFLHQSIGMLLGSGRSRSWRVRLQNRVTSKSLWLLHEGGQLVLRLPVQFLRTDEYKRAQRILDLYSDQSGENDLDDSRACADYFHKEYGSDVQRAVEGVLLVFQKIYCLAPQCTFELSYTDNQVETEWIPYDLPVDQVQEELVHGIYESAPHAPPSTRLDAYFTADKPESDLFGCNQA